MTSSSDERRVFVTQSLPEPLREQLSALPARVVVHDRGAPSREQLLGAVRGCVAVITTVADTIDATVMDAAGESLRVIANCAVGYDNIDLAAAAERGVLVSNTPGVLDRATADVAFGLVIAVTRRLVEADRYLRTVPEWQWGPCSFLGVDISAGATLGIIGMGRIGLEVARRAQAFGMKVLAVDPQPLSDEALSLGVTRVPLAELLARSEVVSLHCPLTPGTYHLIDADALSQMKPGSVLVNTARGALVDETALYKALTSGHLSGAGLDVHENEPAVHAGLLELDNVVMLPHIASAGDRTRQAMAMMALDNVRAALEERPLPNRVG